MIVEFYGKKVNFEITTSLPEVNDEYGYHFGDGITEIVKKVKRCDCISTREDVDIYAYDFYEIETSKTEDDETLTEIYYLAIKKEEN